MRMKRFHLIRLAQPRGTFPSRVRLYYIKVYSIPSPVSTKTTQFYLNVIAKDALS